MIRPILAALLATALLVGPSPAAGAGTAAGAAPEQPGCEMIDGIEVCAHASEPVVGGKLARPSIATLEAAAAADAEATRSDLAGSAGVACDGNGVDGNRVQAVYAYRGSNDRYSRVLPLIRGTYAPQVNAVFRASAALYSVSRRVRWVTSSTCVLKVIKVKVSTNPETNFWGWRQEMLAKGFNRADRKYLTWFDKGAQTACGIGDSAVDSAKAPFNRNNVGPSFGFVVAPCWGQSRASGGISSEAHELMHTLGAVMKGAPHRTPSGHCYDEWDNMCYRGGGDPAMRKVCSTTRKNRFDCKGDDYFNPKPRAGTWLAGHWNTAFSSFLAGVDKATPVVARPVLEADRDEGFLSWTIKEDQLINRVLVERQVDGGAWTAVGGAGLSYLVVSGMQPGHTYSWRVRAMDSAGNWSAWSTPSSPYLLPLNGLPTVAIDPLERTDHDGVAGWYIAFGWTATDPDPDGYVTDEEAQLSSDGGATYTALGWDDMYGVYGTPGHTYVLRVRARDDQGAWGQWAVSNAIAIDEDMPPLVTWLSVDSWEPGVATVYASLVDEGLQQDLVTEIIVAEGAGAPAVLAGDTFPFTPGNTYHVTMRARDLAGQWSAPAATDWVAP